MSWQLFFRGLWMDMTGLEPQVDLRTDAQNLVTAAATAHAPEQAETLFNCLRLETLSASGHEPAHVLSEDVLVDCLTKYSTKPDALIKCISTGHLPNCDKHPPFRDLLYGYQPI